MKIYWFMVIGSILVSLSIKKDWYWLIIGILGILLIEVGAIMEI
jgi:hypothetical protein